ncbi:MAG: hypothetical protein LC700_02565, partial [Actinobacteria bacterium]|nr:hypothetical protein [Actinomycetota bacterium]
MRRNRRSVSTGIGDQIGPEYADHRDPELHALGVTLGKVTTGLLIAEGLDPRAYANSGSYCKALGLNLK